MCHNEEWGTVCDDGWSRTDAIVACRQLGLEFVRITAPYHFEPGSGLIWLDELMCTGNETRLINCEHNGFGIHNCIHYEDAGVVCRSELLLLNMTGKWWCQHKEWSETNLNYLSIITT